MRKMEILVFLYAFGKHTVARRDLVYGREKRFGMISSVRFLVRLETWNPKHKWRHWRRDIPHCYKKEDGRMEADTHHTLRG